MRGGGGGGDGVVAVGVDAAEGVDDVEAEVVAGAGVAAGELLVGFGGVLAVQGHGAGRRWKISWMLMRWMWWVRAQVSMSRRGAWGSGVPAGWRGCGVGGGEGGAGDVGPQGEVVVGVGGGGGGEGGADGGVGRDGAAEPDAVDEVGDGGVGGERGGAGGLFPAALGGGAVVGGDGAGVGGQGGGGAGRRGRGRGGSC